VVDAGLLHRLLNGGRLGHHLEAALQRQQRLEAEADDLVVVDDHDTHGWHGGSGAQRPRCWEAGCVGGCVTTIPGNSNWDGPAVAVALGGPGVPS